MGWAFFLPDTTTPLPLSFVDAVFSFSQEEEEGYCYRSSVRELVPQLRYLDDMHAREEAGSRCSSSMGEDWALLRESFKDCSSTETAEGVCVRVCASVCVCPCVSVCVCLWFYVLASACVHICLCVYSAFVFSIQTP